MAARAQQDLREVHTLEDPKDGILIGFFDLEVEGGVDRGADSHA